MSATTKHTEFKSTDTTGFQQRKETGRGLERWNEERWVRDGVGTERCGIGGDNIRILVYLGWRREDIDGGVVTEGDAKEKVVA